LLVVALAAVTLTFFSLFRVELAPIPHISLRHHAVWQSTETLRVTLPPQRPEYVGNQLGIRALGDLYAELANRGAVRALVLASGPLNGGYEAIGVDQTPHASLPLLSIQGRAPSSARATQIAARVSRAFRAYVEQQQAAARIPRAARVQLNIVSAPEKATLVQGRWPRSPLVVLSVVIALVLLAAFSKFREEHP
jgi:hypothetical protein